MHNRTTVENAPVACVVTRGIPHVLTCATAPIAAVVVASAGLVATAADASFTATLDGYVAGAMVSAGYDSHLAWDSAASVSMWNIKAFQHDFERTDGGGEVLSWCVELYQGVTVGSTYAWDEVAASAVPSNSTPGPMGALKASVLSDLFARWIDPLTGFVIGDLADRNAKSAAFQLAVWEVSHENFAAVSESELVAQMSLAQGAFRSAPSAGQGAWYDAMRSSLGSGGFLVSSVYGLANAAAQDQLTLPPVPAPGALALLALAGVAARRRR